MTAFTVAECLLFGLASAFLACVAAVWQSRKLRERRKDREVARGIARRVREREYLEWLERRFAAMEAGEKP